MRISFQHHILAHALLLRLSLVLVFILVAVTAASASATGVVSSGTRVTALPVPVTHALGDTAKEGRTTSAVQSNQGMSTSAATWNHGNSVYTQTWNCTILGGGYRETLAISSVAYYTNSHGQYRKILIP